MPQNNIPSFLHNFGHSFFSDVNFVEPDGFIYKLIANQMSKYGESDIVLHFERCGWSLREPVPQTLKHAMERYHSLIPEMAKAQSVDLAQISSIKFLVHYIGKRKHTKEIEVRVQATDLEGTVYDIPVRLQD